MTHQLPALHQAVLDDDTLEVLFRDIAICGQDVEVTPKYHVREEVGEASITLDEAHAALQAGVVRAAQVRYTHQGERWCDTLSRGAGGWQLTRINLSDAATV